MRTSGILLLSAAGLAALASQLPVRGQSRQPDAFVARAAEALGGAARIRAIRNADNIAYRHLQVDTDVPVHGRILPIMQVMQDIERQTKAAQDLCARMQSVGVFGPGCPVKTPSAVSETAGR